jgi:hypothetical protein
MKLLLILLSIGLVIASSGRVEAATNKRAKKKQAPKVEVQTNHNFDDHGVAGQYQMPDEALAKVENEKTLSDLLGVRKHFKDRLAEASEQE